MTTTMHSNDAGLIPPGKRIYGVGVGIVTMDRRFPRPLGDMANAATYGFPVLFDTVLGVNGMPALSPGQTHDLYAPIYESCMRLVDKGVVAITTTCGYAALLQGRLAAELPVAFAASSLVQIPSILAALGPQAKLAVLAARGASLTAEHFRGTGVREDQLDRLSVIDLQEAPSFHDAILERPGEVPLDVVAARAEIVALCKAAAEKDTRICGFVAECANVGPYSQAVREATALPVWDGIGLVNWLHHCTTTRLH